MKQRMFRMLSLLFAFSLVAAACGGSSSDAASDGSETETEGEQAGGGVDEDAVDDALNEADGEGETEETTETTEAMAEPQNIEELEAAWAANRAAIVETIKAEGYGLGDDGIVTGPGGFTIDTNTCPADWSDTEGLESSVKIGGTFAQSGNLASYGNIAAGMETYFDYVNANGGIGGQDIEWIVKDDGYVATQTIELVDELLQSDKPFAITTLGSPNTFAVYDTLNEKCVPQPLVLTGHPAWGDPENHPWTTGQQMSYSTEAILWGAWIKKNMADRLPVKVAGLVMENDFGLAYEGGMEAYAEENPDVISDFVAIRHEAAAPTVTNEMTTIAAEQPDVFIAMTAGNPCLLAVQDAARAGLTGGETVLFMPSVCKDPNAYLIPAGDAGNGWNIVGGGVKAFTDPQWADDPYVSWANELIAEAGLDPKVGLIGTGFGNFAWPMVEALRIAAELDGGLTRTNFMVALRSLKGDNPSLLDGINFGMNGNEDAYFVEGSDFSVYDSATTSWISDGDVVDLNGSSPNCAWDKAALSC